MSPSSRAWELKALREQVDGSLEEADAAHLRKVAFVPWPPRRVLKLLDAKVG
jgi:hypothetical protein